MEQKAIEQPLVTGGKFTFELVRGGKVIDTWEDDNLVVNEGLNSLLNVYLGATAKESTWYVALFEGNYTPVASLTAATFAAAATESTAYTEATRPEWVDAPSTTQQITNTASKATFTINDTKTMYGAALISDNVKGGTAGVLFAASRFSVARQVVAEDQLLVTYTVQAASA